MSTAKRDLLFEIGCEELPASFVEAALAALPALAETRLRAERLGFDSAQALGTPRRLALLVRGLRAGQDDLEQETVGPPVRVAFRDGQPTPAATAFAAKLGCRVEELRRTQTSKGEYLCGTRRERGKPAVALLPAVLAEIVAGIPFRKSMRWGDGSWAAESWGRGRWAGGAAAEAGPPFGRPVRWLLCLFGAEPVPVAVGGLGAAGVTYGHRFLCPGAVPVGSPDEYAPALRRAHVLVDPEERGGLMRVRLEQAARDAGGELVEDEFLVKENLSLCEEPQVVAGSFDPEFLVLPEPVILAVARGHQRYFGLRGEGGKLLPQYLAVVNTAQKPELVRQGNDRVMRARLADARFFYEEDRKRPLGERRPELAGIVFQSRLGSVLDKAERIEPLAVALGRALGLAEASIAHAREGARLCKCDLVSLMVGELPELQGEMGRAYALAQGAPPEVAEVIRDHYLPRGASDQTPTSAAAALVAIADRLDTLVGCFGVGLSPTGAADPYGLRRACLGALRCLLAGGFDLRLSEAFALAHGFFQGVSLDLDLAALRAKLGAFFTERLRGLLGAALPADAVDAALGVAWDRPLDARSRAAAIAELDAATRGRVGEVFKRVTNIAKGAPAGEPAPPASVLAQVHPSEQALFDGFAARRGKLEALRDRGEYAAALGEIAAFAPLLGRYFDDVFVMVEDASVRENRLRLMRAVSELCLSVARLELLAAG